MFSSRKTAAPSSGYNLTKSLRFRSSAGAWLNRTPATTTNRQTYTWSGWVKTSLANVNSSDMPLLTSRPAAGTYTLFQLKNSNTLQFSDSTAGGSVTTTQVFRDPSAWYHIVLAVDTTQATAANRVKMYVNGVQITAFSSTTYPAQNGNTQINVAQTQGIGRDVFDTSALFDGYLAEVNFIDGQQLTPSSFGSTNASTGVWQPAQYTGTYGTNGFYLKFTDTTSTATLGTDYSGNSNTWTVNNISLTAGSTYDSMTDVPTLTSATAANYCVLNPISSGGTITNGNLSTSNNDTTTYGTVAITTGKFYWEYTITACSGGAAIALGVSKDTNRATGGTWGANDVFLYQSGGNKYGNGTSGAYGATYTTGDVIGVALDMTGYTLTFYKNNVSQGTAFSSTQISPYTLIPMFYGYPSGNSTNVNFGQQPFTYTPPTGFVALNTYNLPTSTIVKGNTVMDATTYTGTGSSYAVTNAAGFKPDFVWVKERSQIQDYALFDSVRGATKQLSSNTTGAEATYANSMSAFNSNGFTVVSDAVVNSSGQTYVGWQWQAGQGSSSSNTNGSITSTVSVNATAGFSVLKFPASGSSGSIGHGLGVAPSLIFLKNTASADDWYTYHVSIGTSAFIRLNTTGAQSSSASAFTAVSSSTFTVGSGVLSNNAHVAYCWAAIPGFSAFGSYTGNGSTDGPFVYTGFRPRYWLIKCTSAGYSWEIYDTARNTYNAVNTVLLAENASSEFTGGDIDFLSNGFKLRTTRGSLNTSSLTYIYAAFAENPFKYANAR